MSFTDWTRAIPPLVERTGPYCHLCEMRVTNPIAIEHLFFKDGYPRLKDHWNNFLLACYYCNSRKGNKRLLAPYRKKYFWPHLHNTITKFEYPVDGSVRPKSDLSSYDQECAQRTIALYCLDAEVTANGNQDQRRLERLETIKIAIDLLLDFQRGKVEIRAIVDVARSRGFFSIWYSLFYHNPEVRKALVEAPDFHLAETMCFDAEGLPVQRA